MRIACLQFAPVKGDVEKNQLRADGVLAKGDTQGLDLIVLPEMAFTGYNFSSVSEIEPYLEPSGSGITSMWARTVARKYRCTVVCPYAEKNLGGSVLQEPNADSAVSIGSSSACANRSTLAVPGGTNPAGPKNHNSAIIVNKDAAELGHYRKYHLYEVDEAWASEGERGFFNEDLPGLGRVVLGMSMDINPCRFETAWMNYEFAMHALDVEANILIVSMSWPTYEDYSSFSQWPQEPAMNTLSYWILRLHPLIRSRDGKERIVVIANRVGQEDDLVYAGTSAVLGIVDGDVMVYGISGRANKELLVVDTEKPPHGKLLYRPEEEVNGDEPNGFYGTSVESDEQEGMPTSPEKKSTLGSPRADSDVLGAHEHPKAVPHVPAPAKPLPPKLSVRTDVDNFKGSDSELKSARTPLVFSPTQVHRPTPHPSAPRPSAATSFRNAARAWANHLPSPRNLFKGAVSRSSPKSAETNAATIGSGAMSARSRRSSFDGNMLHLFTPSGEHSGSNVSSARSSRPKKSPEWMRTGAISQLTSPLKDSISTPEVEVKLDAVARELQSMALNMTDEDSDQPRKQRRDPSRKGRSPSLHDDRRRTPSATPHQRQPRSESQNGLDDLAASRARFFKQTRSESQNGLGDLAASQTSFSRQPSRTRCESCGRHERRNSSRGRNMPASATDKWQQARELDRQDGREERGRRREPREDVWNSPKEMDNSESSFDRRVSQMLQEKLKRIEGDKREPAQSSYLAGSSYPEEGVTPEPQGNLTRADVGRKESVQPSHTGETSHPGEVRPPEIPSRPSTPVMGRKASPRRSRSHSRQSWQMRPVPPYYPYLGDPTFRYLGDSAYFPSNRRSWSATRDRPSRSNQPVHSANLQGRVRSRSLLPRPIAGTHTLASQGHGPKIPLTPPDDGIPERKDKRRRSSRPARPVSGLPTPRSSPTGPRPGWWI